MTLIRGMVALAAMSLCSASIAEQAAPAETDQVSMRRSEIDRALSEIAPHAEQLPLHFVSKEERMEVQAKLQKLLNFLDAAITKYPDEEELLFGDAIANGFGHNMGCPDFAIGKNSHPFVNSPGLVSLDSLSLGAYNLGKVQLLVTVGPPYVSPGLPPQIGSFALPTLFGVDYELDFAHNKLNLFSTTHCPGNVVYWTDKEAATPYTLDKIGVPVFPIELDGKKISASLQVGGSGTRLKTDVAKALYGFDEHSPGIRSDSSDSGKTVNHYRAMKMTLPGLSVTNADVQLVAGLDKRCDLSPDSGPEHSATYNKCFGSPPLTLGLDVLQHLRLYFATEEHILYITAADAGRPTAAGEVKLQSQ